MDISLLFILVLGVQCITARWEDSLLPKLGTRRVRSQRSKDCQTKMDLQLVVDGSGSVGLANFNALNNLIADNLIGAFDISPDSTRVAYVVYSDAPNIIFELDTFSSKAPMEAAVKSVGYPSYRTFTGKAMTQALKHFRPRMRTSPDVLKTLMVFTDGESHDSTVEISKDWNDLGAKVVAVGIGTGISQTGLESIAGSHGQILRMNGYGQEDINAILDQIKDDLCNCLSDSVTPVVYNGTAGASSIYSDSYAAQNAFNQEDPDARWSSTAGYPGKIWFKFTSAVKVAKLSFSSVQSEYWKESPKAFNVIASNDCSNWDILLSVTNSGFTGENQEKTWQIPCTQQKSYQCYGIEGTENLGYGTDYISLKKMKMFQLDVDNCAQNPCKHGTCQDKLNDFTCACDSGWEGKTCEQKTCKSLSDSVTPMVYDGTAGASSIYSDSYVAQNAFDQEDPDARWSSKAGYPGKIWFNFTSAIKVAKLSFSSVQSKYWKESPKAFNVIASNDCSNWEILLSVTNSGFTGENQEKSWQIPCTQQKSYQCYGIEGTENLGYGTDYISLKKMKMFQ